MTSGSVLTASTSGISDVNGLPDESEWTYQWQRSDDAQNWTDITGATGTSYTLATENLGNLIRAAIRFEDDDGGAEEILSEQSPEAVRPQGSIFATTLTLSSGSRIGNPVFAKWASESRTAIFPEDRASANTGTEFPQGETIGRIEFLHVPTPSYSVSDDNRARIIVLDLAATSDFTREDAESLIINLSSSTGELRLLPKDMEYRHIDVLTAHRFTQINVTESWPRNSKVLLVISELPDNQKATGSLTLTGEPRTGETLKMTLTGVDDPNGLAPDVQYRYQWQTSLDAQTWTDIDGATATTHAIRTEDIGQRLRATVTFTDLYDYEEGFVTEPTETVYGIPAPVMLEQATYIIWAPSADDTTTGYQVLRRLKDFGQLEVIAADTGNTNTFYLDASVEAGVTYEYAVKAITPKGLSPLSNSVLAMRAKANMTATGAPVLTGVPQAGTAFTADVSSITDANGFDPRNMAYHWYLTDGITETRVLVDRTAKSYTPGNADVGKRIKVRVTFKDDTGYEESLTSELSTVVIPGDLWKATMTVDTHSDRSRTFHGYSSLGVEVGSLTANNLRIGNDTNVVHTLGYYTNQQVLLTLFDNELPETYKLTIGQTEFTVSDATHQSLTGKHSYTWPLNGFSLTPGETVEVMMQDTAE